MFSGIRIAKSLRFLCSVLQIIVCPCFLTLYCLSIDLRLLITHLGPSNFVNTIKLGLVVDHFLLLIAIAHKIDIKYRPLHNKM